MFNLKKKKEEFSKKCEALELRYANYERDLDWENDKRKKILELEYEGRKQHYEGKKIASLQQAAKDTADIEHDYHYSLEKKGNELAKLDAEINVKTEYLDKYNEVMEEKDRTIDTLRNVIKDLSVDWPMSYTDYPQATKHLDLVKDTSKS